MPLTYVKWNQQKHQRYSLLFFLWTLIALQLTEDVISQELEEGETCESHRGIRGICVRDKIKDCPGMPQSMARIGYHTNDAIRCGYYTRGEIICCPIDALPIPTTTTNAPISQGEEKARKACQDILNTSILATRIITDELAKPSEFPHMAALIYNRVGMKCGGSLIAGKFILTAAHCVVNRNYQPTAVVLGEVNLSNPRAVEAAKHEIHSITIHPNYQSLEKYNDIAIIELEFDVTYGVKVFPACLQIDEINPLNDSEDLFITGWGTTNSTTKQFSDKLRKATVRAISLEDCQSKYRNRPFELKQGILNTQICTTDPKKKTDACWGDSGGPLSRMITPTKYCVVGIISSGENCATIMPGLYTRVSKYLDFIAGVVWK